MRVQVRVGAQKNFILECKFEFGKMIEFEFKLEFAALLPTYIRNCNTVKNFNKELATSSLKTETD